MMASKNGKEEEMKDPLTVHNGEEPEPGMGHPGVWKPTVPGTQLLGVVTDVSWPFVKSADEHRWMLEITDLDNKAWSVWCDSAVMKRLIVEVMPAVGAEVVITYDGIGTTASGYDFDRYQMAASNFDVELYHRIMNQSRETP